MTDLYTLNGEAPVPVHLCPTTGVYVDTATGQPVTTVVFTGNDIPVPTHQDVDDLD